MFVTVRNVVGKVMFLHVAVILSTGEGGGSGRQTPSWQVDTLLAGRQPSDRPLQRTVRILLECILVDYTLLFISLRHFDCPLQFIGNSPCVSLGFNRHKYLIPRGLIVIKLQCVGQQSLFVNYQANPIGKEIKRMVHIEHFCK